MNKSDLRNIIKEEVRKVINTTLTESNLKDMLPEGPGTYKISYTTERGQSFDDAEVTITERDIELAKDMDLNGFNFWNGVVRSLDDPFFTKGDRVKQVTKIN